MNVNPIWAPGSVVLSIIQKKVRQTLGHIQQRQRSHEVQSTAELRRNQLKRVCSRVEGIAELLPDLRSPEA
ncbi:MAG TPA: hypothetical protein VLJ11_22170 [Bryobacteraceae bacterium]|nr:hypothetical protein [Bryobacteraceae bacterium]